MANPITAILNMRPTAPVALPQSGEPMVVGPSAVNLSANVPAPRMAPQSFAQADLPTTTSLDLPASLQGLLGSGSPPVSVNEQGINQQNLAQTGTVAQNSNAPVLDFRLQPTFADGGMVGDNGMPVRPKGIQSNKKPMSAQMREMQLQDFMRKNPQQVQQISNAMLAGVQSGEITMEELQMGAQLAMTALQNPEMYKYVRQYAIQQGLAMEEDLPPEYDEGLIYVILLAARSVQQSAGGAGGNMNTPGGMNTMNQQPMMSMADGGYVSVGDHAAGGGKVVGPGTETSDSIPIRVSKGEFVIPAHVVRAKGVDFFNSLLEKYKA